MRSSKLIFVFVLVAAFGFAVYQGTAEESHDRDSGIYLEKGRNLIEIERAVLVRELVVLNPEIEYVSYVDEFLNKPIAYVNAFGGLGDNFLVRPGEVYEISVSEDIELVT